MQEFLKKIAVYFFGNVFSKLIAIMLLPLYTRYVTTEDFGYFDFVTTILGVILPVFFLEIWSGILRFMFDSEELEWKRKVFFNGFIFAGLCSVAFVVIFMVVGKIFEVRFLWYIILYALFSVVQNIYQATIRGLGKDKVFVISGILSSVGLVCANIICLAMLNLSLEGLYISLCTSTLLSIIFIESKCKLMRNMKVTLFSAPLIKSITKYCAPLIINSISFYFLSTFNRLVIVNTLGMQQNGLYAIATRFSAAISLFVGVFSLAWQESAYSNSHRIDRSQFYSYVINIYVRFLGGALLVLIPATYFLFPLVTSDDYHLAKSIIPVCYAGAIISAISNFMGHIFGAEKRTSQIFYTTLFGSVVSAGFALIFIRGMGLFAAGLSVLLGFLVTVWARFYWMKRSNIHIKIEKKYLIGLLFLYVVVSYLYNNSSSFINLITLSLMFVFWIYTSKDLINQITSILKNK